MQIPNYNSNLAYDLSRFDVAEQEQQNSHRRQQQEKAKQEIRMNSRSVSRSGSRVKILLVSGLVFAALCAVNVQKTTADDWARKVADQQTALVAQQNLGRAATIHVHGSMHSHVGANIRQLI